MFQHLTDEPERVRLWSLREDALVETGSDDSLLVFTRWGDIEIDDPSPVVREWLYRMSLGPVSLENLLPPQPDEHARPVEDDPEYDRVQNVLSKLGSCVVHSLGLADMGGPLLSAVPISRKASFQLPRIESDHPVRLSRFAAMRASDGEVVLESPLARHRVIFHRSLATRVIGSLGKATTVADLAPALDVPEALVADIVTYVAAVGMIVLSENGGSAPTARFAEDSDPSLVVWSHSDLLFHARSKLSKPDAPRQATYPRGDKMPPPPAVKPLPDGPRYPLHKPVLAEIVDADPKFTEVLENRRSFRKFARRPLTAHGLGELLFRSARIRSVRPAEGGGVSYAVSDRPYPSSASLHELELYLTLDRCSDLPRGIYHYDPLGHALTLINTSSDKVGELLDDAKAATGAIQRPPALITMTARMGRLSWMYNGIAYATTLRHVGVLQQTLYLVATAMGLAPCALSVGDIEVSDSAFLLQWPSEVTVGGFVVGLRPEVPAEA
ncbi:SagB family peptide dehydrogenase [Kibdelosporangium philippinense]|uniref:SagB family peptide dehydrogenase n=1 Tax=Kibdelosporangium philippinense TaxID=211113 RepID=A0ABS8ZAJ2_9PSEU|nr:SagB family peptide dehydrogenase [Kibdelosporangium philippinense]MCE7003543.1 SagB family peptide dehydrogenase [Kibdelosporangium philippinense]